MELRRENNFAFLLLGITCFLILGPIAEIAFGAADGTVMMAAYSGMLIIGIWGLHSSRAMFVAGTLLALACVSLTIANLLSSTDFGPYLLFVLLIFQLISIWITGKFVFTGGEVTVNRLMGSICLYLLLGLTYNILYTFLIYAQPAAFSGISGVPGLEKGNIYWEMTYFSFVTMTTLGYGDIHPVAQLAKVLAYSQAIVGELYVAILIGVLVGSYISGRQAKAH